MYSDDKDIWGLIVGSAIALAWILAVTISAPYWVDKLY